MIKDKNWVIDGATVYYPAPDITSIETDLAKIKEKLFATAKDSVTVTAKPLIREMEFSGKKGRKIVGGDRITGWEVQAEGTFLGVDEAMLSASLFEKVTNSSTKFDKYVPAKELLETAYNNMVIVGTVKGVDGDGVIAVIKNTYNEEGMTLEMKDNDESGCKTTFKGHYEMNSDVPPVEIYVVKEGQVFKA